MIISHPQFIASNILYISLVLAHKISTLIYFLKSSTVYLHNTKGDIPVSAILPENIEMIILKALFQLISIIRR